MPSSPSPRRVLTATRADAAALRGDLHDLSTSRVAFATNDDVRPGKRLRVTTAAVRAAGARVVVVPPLVGDRRLVSCVFEGGLAA